MGLIDSIIGAESGGDPNATNPRSSASGAGQFIDSTWLDTIRKARPDLADGKSDQELLSLKTDPQLSRQMTEAYAAQNGEILSKAGQPVTPGTTYLAHFAGPQGAIKILQADPNASAGDILGPAVLKANPFLQGMTAQGLQAWAARKMGTTAPQPGVASAPAASPPGAPLALTPQAPPVFAPPPSSDQQQAAAPMAPPPDVQPPPMSAPPHLAAMPGAPMFAPPRRPVDLSKLRAALGNPGLFNGKRA